MEESEICRFIVPVHVLYIGYDGNVKQGKICVNIHIASNVADLFNKLLKQKFPINSIEPSYNRPDTELIQNNISTGYNFRKVAGTDKWSKHAYGKAIDINPKDNPASPTKFAEYYNYTPTHGVITPEVVSIAESCGFSWGGYIFGKFYDPHHFEI